MKPRLQKRRKREAVLRGLSERAVLAREFRSSRAFSTLRVQSTGESGVRSACSDGDRESEKEGVLI